MQRQGARVDQAAVTVPQPATPWVASLRALQQAAAVLAEAGDLAYLLQQVGEQVELVVPYHTLRLFLLDQDEEVLYPVAIRSLVEEVDLADLSRPEFRLPLGRGVTGSIAANRRPEVVYDLEAHPSAYHIPGTPRVEESFMGVPLLFRGELLGVLTLSKHGLAQFTSEQMALLEVLAVSIAAAIAHRRAVDAEAAARIQQTRLQRLHSTFIANIGHELRTPLTTASGFLELAQARMEAPEALPTLLDASKRGLDRLRTLIEDLLEAVALEAGRQKLQLEPASLRRLVSDAAERSQVPPERLRVEGDVEGQVLLDGGRVVHVLAELFENGIKYGPAGGVITVALQDDGMRVQIEVSDEGPGIPDGEAEVVFERFTQRDPTSTRQQGGTGMGLTLARSIARWHGGDLVVRPGAPTTFRLTIPRVPAEPA